MSVTHLFTHAFQSCSSTAADVQNPVILPDLPVFQRPAGHYVVAFVHAAQHLLPILPDRFPGVAGDGDLLLGAFVGG